MVLVSAVAPPCTLERSGQYSAVTISTKTSSRTVGSAIIITTFSIVGTARAPRVTTSCSMPVDRRTWNAWLIDSTWRIVIWFSSSIAPCVIGTTSSDVIDCSTRVKTRSPANTASSACEGVSVAVAAPRRGTHANVGVSLVPDHDQP